MSDKFRVTDIPLPTPGAFEGEEAGKSADDLPGLGLYGRRGPAHMLPVWFREQAANITCRAQFRQG